MIGAGPWAARLAPLLLLPLPTSALAATMQYLTYNAFEETVAAFQRLALIASDPLFVVIAGCMIAASVVIGALIFAAQAQMGQGGNPLALLVPFLLGLIVFFGAVMPKGTVVVYDPVRNKSQAVGSVPDIIVLLAGGLSAVEREFTRIADTASATPYGDDAGAINYSLLLGASRAPGISTSLEDTIAQYMMDCGFTAMGAGHNGVTKNELLRTSTDLYATFAKFSHPSWPTVYYPDGNDGGLTGTCADSWTYIDSKLGNGNVAATLADLTGIVCSQAGFNPTDAAQLIRCQDQIATAADLYGVTTASSPAFLRSYAFAAGITKMQNNPNFSVAQSQMVNRQLMAEGFGSAEAMNQWVPKLRGFLVATVLGITPVALIFIATPLVFRALALVAGLFVWLALWGISDAISVQMAQDAAAAAFAQIQEYHLGYEAIMNTPDAAVQALGIFGKARTMALMIATVLSAGLLKFGGYAFTSMAQSWQNDLGQAGQHAGQHTMQPDLNARVQQGMIDAPGQMARSTQVGFDTAAAAAGQSVARNGYSAEAQRAYVNHEKLAGGWNELNRSGGAIDAGQVAGSMRGIQTVSDRTGKPLFNTSLDSSRIGSEGSTAGSLEKERVAHQKGFEGVAGQSEFSARDEGARTGRRRDLVAHYGNPAEGSAFDKLAVQETGALEGQLRATGHGREGPDPRRYVDAQTVEARRALAGAEQFDRKSGMPERVGAADTRRAQYGAQALENAERSAGGEAIVSGMTFDQERGAFSGRAADRLGGTADVAHDLADQNVVHQLAQARLAKSLARELGMRPYNLRDRLDVAQMQNGLVSLSVPESQREAFATAFERSGALNLAQLAEFRGGTGPQTVNFAYDSETGDLGAARLSSASEVSSGEMVRSTDGVVRQTSDVVSNAFERSSTEVLRDTSLHDYSSRIEGAAAFTQNRAAVAAELMRAFKGDMLNGAADTNSKNQIIGQFSESLAAADFRLSAQNSEAFQGRVNGGFNVGVGTGPTPGANLGLSAGGDTSKTTTDSSSVEREAGRSYYREALDQAVVEGRARAAERADLSVEEQNQYVADYAAIRLQEAHKAAIIEADQQSDPALRQNDVVEDTDARFEQEQADRERPSDKSAFQKLVEFFE